MQHIHEGSAEDRARDAPRAFPAPSLVRTGAPILHRMLKEIQTIRQNEGEPFRRLFFDRSFSLYVWFEPLQHICMFQLCYDKERQEKALTWRESKGFTHSVIDSGESHPLDYKKSPMLMMGGHFDKERVLAELRAEADEVESSVRTFILGKLAEFGGPEATAAK